MIVLYAQRLVTSDFNIFIKFYNFLPAGTFTCINTCTHFFQTGHSSFPSFWFGLKFIIFPNGSYGIFGRHYWMSCLIKQRKEFSNIWCNRNKSGQIFDCLTVINLPRREISSVAFSVLIARRSNETDNGGLRQPQFTSVRLLCEYVWWLFCFHIRQRNPRFCVHPY